MPIQLLPFQQEAADKLRHNGGVLAFRPRTGKTFTILEAIKNRKLSLIVVPATIRDQWKSEAEKYYPTADIHVIAGPNRSWDISPTDQTIIIVSYETLLADALTVLKMQFDAIVLDEIQKVSNPRAKITKVILKLKADLRIGMSGTLISNNLIELYAPITFIKPGIFGNYWAFLSRYVIKDYWGGIQKYINIDELQEKIKPSIIQESDIEAPIPEFTDITTHIIKFDLSEEERTLYDQIRSMLLLEIEEAKINKLDSVVQLQNTLTRLIRLQECVDSLELLGESKKSTKTEKLREIINEIEPTPESKVIVYSRFSRMIEILERELKNHNPLVITGKVKHKQAIIDKFNASNEHSILLITDSASTGTNLYSHCRNIILYDQPYSVGKLTQTTSRVVSWKTEARQDVATYILRANKTIDEKVAKILEKKEALGKQILSWKDLPELLEY